MSDNLTLFQRALTNASDVGSLITNGYNAARSAVNAVYGSINTIAADLSSAISAIQYFINLPVLLEESAFNKVSYINKEVAALYTQVRLLSLPAYPAFLLQWKDLKNTWCANAGSGISSMCLAATFNLRPTDYTYSYQVTAVIQVIVAAYNRYLAALDSMQTANGGELDSFIPNPESLLALDDLINYTVDTLYVLQANSKQSRVITLTKDSNVILIARELYGLTADDSTIDRIIVDNNICNSEIFQVLKGRQIVYYV